MESNHVGTEDADSEDHAVGDDTNPHPHDDDRLSLWARLTLHREGLTRLETEGNGGRKVGDKNKEENLQGLAHDRDGADDAEEDLQHLGKVHRHDEAHELLDARVDDAALLDRLDNGAKVELKGADKPDSLRGVSTTMVVLDEYSYMKENVWGEIIQPTLAETKGSALFVGTPTGVQNHFYDLFVKGQSQNSDYKSWQFTTLDGGFISESEVENAKKNLDKRTFEQEYLAIPKGGKNTAEAQKFVQYAASAKSLAGIAKYISYGPMRKSSIDIIKKGEPWFNTGIEILPHMPTSPKVLKRAIVADPYWWADNGAEVSERFGAWKGN